MRIRTALVAATIVATGLTLEPSSAPDCSLAAGSADRSPESAAPLFEPTPAAFRSLSIIAAAQSSGPVIVEQECE